MAKELLQAGKPFVDSLLALSQLKDLAYNLPKPFSGFSRNQESKRSTQPQMPQSRKRKSPSSSWTKTKTNKKKKFKPYKSLSLKAKVALMASQLRALPKPVTQLTMDMIKVQVIIRGLLLRG